LSTLPFKGFSQAKHVFASIIIIGLASTRYANFIRVQTFIVVYHREQTLKNRLRLFANAIFALSNTNSGRHCKCLIEIN
jgi:hypothetical protein